MDSSNSERDGFTRYVGTVKKTGGRAEDECPAETRLDISTPEGQLRSSGVETKLGKQGRDFSVEG